jgi:hypothetical protein
MVCEVEVECVRVPTREVSSREVRRGDLNGVVSTGCRETR